ncbi:MAG: hypothetical protein WBA07_00180 [Rivularia sp. (in: cyanobacteria)]
MAHSKNTVIPLKPEFRQYVRSSVVEDKSESTAKSVVISVIVIFLWCCAMLLLAKASHKFLQEICLNSVQKIHLKTKY